VLQNQYQPEGRTQSLPPVNGNSSNNQRINSKGDHCASPVRQVFQHDNYISEPVDKAIIGQTEHESHSGIKAKHSEEQDKQKPKKLETPQAQHPLTQDRNKRHTKDKHAKW
jgi:hypothetical protein